MFTEKTNKSYKKKSSKTMAHKETSMHLGVRESVTHLITDQESPSLIPAGIWCQNDVVLTSMRRHHVASTLTDVIFTSCARWDKFRFCVCVFIASYFTC